MGNTTGFGILEQKGGHETGKKSEVIFQSLFGRKNFSERKRRKIV